MGILSRLWVLAGSAGAALMFLATVKAEDAISNVASWPKAFGMDGLAQFLSSAGYDRIAIGAAVCLMLLGAALWWIGRPNARKGAVFEDQVIKICDLIEPRHSLVHGKVFKRCLITGPARVALLNRNAFNLCSSSSDFFVEVAEGAPAGGVIFLENVEFFECHFDANVCLEATRQNISDVKAGVLENQHLADWEKDKWTRLTRLKTALTRS